MSKERDDALEEAAQWIERAHDNAGKHWHAAAIRCLKGPSPSPEKPPGWCPNCSEQPYDIKDGVCGWCGKTGIASPSPVSGLTGHGRRWTHFAGTGRQHSGPARG